MLSNMSKKWIWVNLFIMYIDIADICNNQYCLISLMNPVPITVTQSYKYIIIFLIDNCSSYFFNHYLVY